MLVTTDDGIELAVEAAGDGPGFLLVHGLGAAKEEFAGHLGAFGVHHRAVTFDHRGHGASDKPSDLAAYSLDRLERDVLSVADACGFGRFRLLGHSVGGMVARRVALRAPERVEALILMNTSPGPVPGWDPVLLEAAVEIALTRGKDALKAALDSAAALDTPAHLRLLDERPGYREFGDVKWRALSHIAWAALARAMAHQPDDLAALTTLQCPVLVVVGEQDSVFLASSHAMAEAMPGATFAVIPDAGHSPHFENPDAWFGAVSEFLAAVPAPAS